MTSLLNLKKAEKRRMILIPIHVNNAAQKALERNYRSSFKLPYTLDQIDGAMCKNNGCTAICTDILVAESQCVHHRGMPTSKETDDNFNAGIQLPLPRQHWTCCGRKTTNMLGCTVGKHSWIKRESVDKIRHDWFYRAGLVHVSIFCRSAVPQGTQVECDGLKLNITVAHAFGSLVTVKHFDLFSEVLPSESVMLISEKKVELILKQIKREPWTRLCYEGTLDGAVCSHEEDGEGAFLVEDDEDATCYVVT